MPRVHVDLGPGMARALRRKAGPGRGAEPQVIRDALSAWLGVPDDSPRAGRPSDAAAICARLGVEIVALEDYWLARVRGRVIVRPSRDRGYVVRRAAKIAPTVALLPALEPPDVADVPRKGRRR